jgi:hypothetical protein
MFCTRCADVNEVMVPQRDSIIFLLWLRNPILEVTTAWDLATSGAAAEPEEGAGPTPATAGGAAPLSTSEATRVLLAGAGAGAASVSRGTGDKGKGRTGAGAGAGAGAGSRSSESMPAVNDERRFEVRKRGKRGGGVEPAMHACIGKKGQGWLEEGVW